MQAVVKPILWTYKVSSNGEYEIRIRITQYKEVAYLNTGYTSTAANWDDQNEGPQSSGHPKIKLISRKINELVSEIEFEIKSMRRNRIELISLKDLKDKVRQTNLRIKCIQFFRGLRQVRTCQATFFLFLND